jgi:hypothetical protein
VQGSSEAREAFTKLSTEGPGDGAPHSVEESPGDVQLAQASEAVIVGP